MRKFFMYGILMALPFFLSACDEKKVENGTGVSLKATPEQKAFFDNSMKGINEFKGLSKEKAMDVPR